MLRKLLQLRALSLLFLLAACDTSDILGPEGEGLESFVQSLDVAGLEEVVFSGSSQVEVELLAGGLTAREIAVRNEGRSEEERIQSKIVALEPSDGSGSLTVMLGELTISFNADTRFWFNGDEVEREHFFAEVEDALAAGSEPPVVAERRARDVPQDPDDESFLARDIALTGDGSPNIRVNVDADNLELVPSPEGDEPDAWLTVLGLRIRLRVQDGTTEIEAPRHDFEDVEEFEGRVLSVNREAGSFTLESGVVVHLADRTEVGHDEGLLRSLAAVAEALEAEQAVFAWGSGAVESREPLELLALRVAFKVRAEDQPALHEFEGVVASVNRDAGSFELTDGTVVRLVDRTEVLAGDDVSPSELAGLAEALEAGKTVVAWGKGEVESEEPLTLEALRVVFKVHPAEHDHREEFEGVVTSVDLDGGAVTFEDGSVVRVLDGTEVVAANDHSPTILVGVAEALAAGRKVVAWGSGEVEATEPLVIAALRIVFKTPIEDFERDIVSVDVQAGTLTLQEGWVVSLNDDTELLAADDISPSTLQAVKDAMDEGAVVRTWGWGFVVGHEPVRIEAWTVTFRRKVEG